MRGVVDSDDLPLNVGREILQQSRALRIIKQRLVKKCVEMMSDLASSNATAYNTFFKNFGKYIKVGIIEDEKSRDDLIPLIRFFSSNSDVNMTSLPEYVARMPEDQKNIYYVVGETRAQAAMSPTLGKSSNYTVTPFSKRIQFHNFLFNFYHIDFLGSIEKLKQKGHEVLYVSEPIDEMTLQNIEKFSDKMITDAGREATTDLSEDEKREKDRQNEDLEGFRKWLKGVLGDKITRVEVSTRLVDSPATLVQSEYGVSPSMQKYLRAQAVVENDADGQFSNIFNQAVLEVNPSHPIIQRLKGKLFPLQSD